jgi:hypothetical protein
MPHAAASIRPLQDRTDRTTADSRPLFLRQPSGANPLVAAPHHASGANPRIADGQFDIQMANAFACVAFVGFAPTYWGPLIADGLTMPPQFDESAVFEPIIPANSRPHPVAQSSGTMVATSLEIRARIPRGSQALCV